MLFSFAFALILAYFLNGYTTKLANLVGSRTIASLLIVALLIVVIILVFSLAIPLLYNQMLLFLKSAPQLIIYLENSLKVVSPVIYNFLESKGASSVLEYMLSVIPQISTQITQHLWSSTLAIANIIILLVFTPIILVYLLNDWPQMVATIKEMIPPRYRSSVKAHMEFIDASIAGYVIGQAKISFILGIVYTALLFLLGAPYYFLIGVSTGVLLIIPYFGNITAFVITHLVVLSHASSIIDVLPITLVFIVCGLLESIVLSPKLLSKSVNLHPLWVILSITIGGMSFGFAGILLAVPVAAIMAGFIRLGISWYKESSYYQNETVDTH